MKRIFLNSSIIVLFALFAISAANIQAEAAQVTLKTKNSGIVFQNIEHGMTVVKGADAGYYYLKTRIKAKSQTDFSFRKNSCTLVDSSGKRIQESWISITGGSAGLSFSQSAPIAMKTYEATIGDKSIKLNTSKIDGPTGSLDIKLPTDGYVDICFLWPVAKGFKPVKGLLSGLADIDLSKR